jgi:hypothetical protein|tara:strand:- start:1807 stop:2070 length:264 start_codon:yes stop_codon:yes gene_type:complete
LLRGSGSYSIEEGIMQDYLFQANSARGNARIYRSNANNFTQLASVLLAPSGINTPRWYRATVNGDFIYNVDIGDDKWHLVSSPVDGE